MINVGVAGIGFMGWIHTLAYRQVESAKIVAYCEQDRKRLAGDWSTIQGNFGPPAPTEPVDMSPYATYDDYDKMLANPDIDVVDICLPPAAHPDMAIKALEAGKHVFCEKPMALTVEDTQRMVAAAETSGKLLLIGHVLPFFPEYQFAYQAVVGGQYGKLLGGNFKRVISDPQWLPDYYKPERVGGPMLDLHVHDAHYIRLLFGAPEAVTSQGRMRGEVAEYFNTLFKFADADLVVTAVSGVINQQGRAFEHAYEIHLEKATLLFDFAVIGGEGKLLIPVTVLKDDDSVEVPELGSGDPVDAFVAEVEEMVRSVESGQPSPILGCELARDAIVICQRQTASIQSGGTQTM